MFEFFRDIYLESRGIDSQKAELDRLEKKKEKEKEKIVFSKSVKYIVYLFGGFYVLSTLAIFPLLIQTNSWGILLKDIVQIIVAIMTIIMLLLKKKRTEIIAIILLIVFMVLQYSSVIMTFV